MTDTDFVKKILTENDLNARTDEKLAILNAMTVTDAAKLYNHTTRLASLWSVQRKLMKTSIPLIEKCKSGYCLFVYCMITEALQKLKKKSLVQRLFLQCCTVTGFVEHNEISALATGYFAKFLGKNTH